MARKLSQMEMFDKITVTQSNDDWFVKHNTSPLPDVEPVKVDGDWFFVHPIRYTGSTGKKNTWRL